VKHWGASLERSQEISWLSFCIRIFNFIVEEIYFWTQMNTDFQDIQWKKIN